MPPQSPKSRLGEGGSGARLVGGVVREGAGQGGASRTVTFQTWVPFELTDHRGLGLGRLDPRIGRCCNCEESRASPCPLRAEPQLQR